MPNDWANTKSPSMRSRSTAFYVAVIVTAVVIVAGAVITVWSGRLGSSDAPSGGWLVFALLVCALGSGGAVAIAVTGWRLVQHRRAEIKRLGLDVEVAEHGSLSGTEVAYLKDLTSNDAHAAAVAALRLGAFYTKVGRKADARTVLAFAAQSSDADHAAEALRQLAILNNEAES